MAQWYNNITRELFSTPPWQGWISKEKIDEYKAMGWGEVEDSFTPPRQIDQEKQSKLNYIDTCAATAYVGGFYSTATGELLKYDSDVPTQNLLDSLYVLATAAPDVFNSKVFYEGVPAGHIPIRAWVAGEKEVKIFDVDMIILLGDDLTKHKGTVKAKVWNLQEQVKLATTVEQLDLIVWE